MSDENIKTILLVEDEVIIAMEEKRFLEKEGYRILHAISGEEAVEIVCVKKEPVGLILMDISLGSGMDGAQAARQILLSHDVPIIFTSARTEQEIDARTEEITSYGHFVKQCGPMVLLTTVKMAFKLHEIYTQLSESAERLRDVSFSMADWIWEVDENGVYTYSSQKGSDFFGSPRENIIGKTPFDLMPPDEARRVAAIFSELKANKAPIKDLENWNIDKNGAEFCLLTNGVPILDKDGNLKGYRGVDKDITERKQAEKALRESEKNLRDAQRLTHIGSWQWTVATDTVQWSEELYRIHGRDPNLAAPSYAELASCYTPESWARLNAAVTRALQSGESYGLDLEIVRSDGTIRLTTSWAEADYDAGGKIIGLHGTVQDVTEQKRIEAALSESEAKYRTLFETMAQGVIYQDASGEVISANPAAQRILGLTLDKLQNMTSVGPGWKIVHEDGSAFPEETFPGMIALSTGKEIRNVLMGIYNPHLGEHRWISIYAMPQFRPGEDVPYQAYNTLEDITERKRAEDKVKTLLHNKEVLLKEVHHRMKNNMNAIASLFQLQLNAEDDPSVKMALQDAESRIQTMMVLYDRLHRSETFSAISIREYFPHLLDEITGLFPRKNPISIKIQLEDIVLAPELLYPLGIILNELTTNAMKYAFSEQRDGWITLTATREADDVTIIFQDNGIGIPESFTFGKSTGFGMQLVGMLVQQIKGSISLERNNGAKFIIKFPLE